MQITKLDAVDKKILEILQRDGRISMKLLGEKVGLSPPAAAGRVSKMEEAGLIEYYSAHVNPEALGYQVEATIVLALYIARKRSDFVEFVQSEEDIIRADELPGRSDAILQVVCQSYECFLELVKRIRQFGTTDSYIHMGNYKNDIIYPQVEETDEEG